MTQDWTFEGMGSRFDEHVAAHLPGYFDVQRMVALVAQEVVTFGGLVVDVGASTGQTVRSISAYLDPARRARYLLYDADASMLHEARRHDSRFGLSGGIDYVQARLPDDPMVHSDAALTLMLWFLQFCPPTDWVRILAEARQRSADTGVLLVAAKTRHPDVRWQAVAVSALDDYKDAQGVSPAERSAKTRALRGTLYEATVADYAADMREAGWTAPTVLWRWHVWSVLGAWARDDR